MKRLRKLYPQYLSSMYACVLFNLAMTGFAYVNFKNIILNSLMMATGWVENVYQYNSPHWFAGVLMLCYTAFYGVCVLARREKRYFTYGCVAMVLWGYILINRNWDFPFCYFWDGEGLLNFFLGCIVCDFLDSPTIQDRTKRWTMVIGFVAVILFFVLSGSVGFEVLSGDSRYVLAMMFCPAILMISVKLPIASVLLGNKIMRFMGKFSTAIFFWHIPLYQVVYFVLYSKGRFFNEVNWRIRLAAFLLLLACLSLVCSFVFEQGLNDEKNRVKTVEMKEK